MKVGIDLSPIGFRSRAPGTAVHVENQARALLAREVDWEWVLVATKATLRDTPFFESFDPIVVDDAPLTYHVCCRLGSIWSRARCDLGLATAFFAPFFGPPVLTNYFDANYRHPVRDHSGLRATLKRTLLQSLIAFSRRRSRVLFTLTEHTRVEMIKADPASAPKWVVAPCGVPPVPLVTEVPAWAVKLKGRPFLLYVGAFSQNKNQHRLIAAWDHLSRQREDTPALVLLGPTPSDFIREVITPAIAATKSPEKIIITGFVSDEEVAWAYQHACAYLQPSFAEGFGLPVVQAMSCGVPVACSDSTSLPEVAGGAALLFKPDDIRSIAATLLTLTFDETERSRLRQRGLERAKKFSWENHAAIVASRIGQELARLKGQNSIATANRTEEDQTP